MAHVRGEKHGRAKLTTTKVLKIRELYATGNYLQRELADLFDVSRSTIRAIVNRENWTWL